MKSESKKKKRGLKREGYEVKQHKASSSKIKQIKQVLEVLKQIKLLMLM